jgi:hypothetical protein
MAEKELMRLLLVLQSRIVGLQLAAINPAGPVVPKEVRDKVAEVAHAMGAVSNHVLGVNGKAVGARSDGLCDSGRVEFGIAPPTCPTEGAALGSELLPFPSVATDRTGLYAASSASGVTVERDQTFPPADADGGRHG